jgi:tetratricopeptide (TPR) repeat protein
MRASLLWDFGDRNNALEAVGRATELDRHYSWAARTQVRWLSECGRDDDALAAADDFLRANPTTALAHDLRALALEALGRHDDRVVALQRALDFDPRSVAVRLRLLRALTELKRFDAARPVIETGLALLGRHPDLLLADIRIDRERGDLVQARERLQGLLREQPDFTGGWERLIIWCDEEGRADDILAWYRQPPAALAREARLPAYASDILWKRGQRTEAVQALQEALQLEPDYFWARDRLAEWLLEQHRPPEVLALLPEHASPDQVPFHTAARLAQAAAMTGDQVRAETFFERLLRDPSPDVDLLFAADRTLLSRQSSRQRELLRRTLATAKQPRVRESCLLVLAGRGDRRRFFARIGPFLASLPSTGREGPLGRLLYSASRQFGDRPVAAWAAVNLKPPIRDVDAWGCIAFALSGKRGSKVLLRIAGDYRRPGVRGWMLANYVGALHNCKRFDEMTTVARYALAEVPQDHSVWWHRRYLAEAALRRGDFEECRRLAEMPTEEFPTIRVEMEAMQVLARMRQTKGWFARRRLLHAALPSLLQQWRRADAERREAKKPARFELSSWFLRCIPTVDAALLLYGRNARPWLERRARRRSPPPT